MSRAPRNACLLQGTPLRGRQPPPPCRLRRDAWCGRCRCQVLHAQSKVTSLRSLITLLQGAANALIRTAKTVGELSRLGAGRTAVTGQPSPYVVGKQGPK